MPRQVWAILTPLWQFCWCFLYFAIVTCRCDTAGSRASFVSSQKPLAVDTNIIGHSWNTHHLTCHTVTITLTMCCKHEEQKFTQTQPSAWIHVPYDHWRVSLWAWLCVTCMFLCVSVCLREDSWRPSFISCCDQVFYMIWYDDTGPIKGWGCVKNVMTGQAED